MAQNIYKTKPTIFPKYTSSPNSLKQKLPGDIYKHPMSSMRYSRKMTYGEYPGEHKEQLKTRLREYEHYGADLIDVIEQLDELFNFSIPVQDIPKRLRGSIKTVMTEMYFDSEGNFVVPKRIKWQAWKRIIISTMGFSVSIGIILLTIFYLIPLINATRDVTSEPWIVSFFIHFGLIIIPALLASITIVGSVWLVTEKSN